jgi:dipeptidyl-peptidase-4
LAQQGYLVLKLDNRGTWGRGHGFEAPVHLRLGQVEVEDQVAGVEFLVQRGLVDPERVGIYGWSYGGYMAALCLTKRPDVFQAGVAGAPVIEWQRYDSLYTERYMGVPQVLAAAPEAIVNSQGYDQASVLTHLANLQGQMLVIHGMRDENVLLQQTIVLLEKAAELDKSIDLLLLPQERHRVRSRTMARWLEQRLFDYLHEALG